MLNKIYFFNFRWIWYIFDMNEVLQCRWKIIFYPKGQYDFSVDSRRGLCVAYIKLISCDKNEIKTNINIYWISHRHHFH